MAKYLITAKGEDHPALSDVDVGAALVDHEEWLAVVTAVRDVLRSRMTTIAREWNLSTRASNLLVRLDVRTEFDINQITSKEILSVRGLGRMTFMEILQEGSVHGYALPEWKKALSRMYETAKGVV